MPPPLQYENLCFISAPKLISDGPLKLQLVSLTRLALMAGIICTLYSPRHTSQPLPEQAIFFWPCKSPVCFSSSNLKKSPRYDEWFKNMHNFDDYLVSHSQLAAAQEPDDPLYNPYTWTHDQEETPVWAIMAQDPEKI